MFIFFANPYFNTLQFHCSLIVLTSSLLLFFLLFLKSIFANCLDHFSNLPLLHASHVRPGGVARCSASLLDQVVSRSRSLSRVAQCVGKLRQGQTGDSKTVCFYQHPRKSHKNVIARSALAKLLPEVQVPLHSHLKGVGVPVCVFCGVLISPLHSATPLQAIKQTLSEVFAVYLSFATELEEQSKQLLEKLEQARGSLRGGDAESESELRGSPGTLSMAVGCFEKQIQNPKKSKVWEVFEERLLCTRQPGQLITHNLW